MLSNVRRCLLDFFIAIAESKSQQSSYIYKLEPTIIVPTNSIIVCNYQSQTINLNNGLPRNIEPIPFYQLLEENEIDKAIAVKLAPEIEQAIAEVIVVDWVHKEDVQRKMRKRLRRLMMGQTIPRSEAEPIIIKLMDVARVN